MRLLSTVGRHGRKVCVMRPVREGAMELPWLMTTWVAGIWAPTANVPPLLRRRPAAVSVPPPPLTKHHPIMFS